MRELCFFVFCFGIGDSLAALAGSFRADSNQQQRCTRRADCVEFTSGDAGQVHGTVERRPFCYTAAYNGKFLPTISCCCNLNASMRVDSFFILLILSLSE